MLTLVDIAQLKDASKRLDALRLQSLSSALLISQRARIINRRAETHVLSRVVERRERVADSLESEEDDLGNIEESAR